MSETQLPVFDPLTFLSQFVDSGTAIPFIAWGFAGAVLVFVGFYTIVLLYHWIRYGGSSVFILSAMAIYLGGAFVWISSLLRSLSLIVG